MFAPAAPGHVALYRNYAIIKKWTSRWRIVEVVSDEGEIKEISPPFRSREQSEHFIAGMIEGARLARE